MRSRRPAGMDPQAWKIIGPYQDRLAKRAAAKLKKEIQPQEAPLEEVVLKVELLPRQDTPPTQGGASSSSAPPNQGGDLLSSPAGCVEMAMPATAHSEDCVCIHCIANRQGDSEDDLPTIVYNQHGTVFDPAVPGQVP